MGKFSDGMPEQGGDWFKFKEGQNRIRIASNGEPLGEHFKVGVCYGKKKGCKGCTGENPTEPSFKKLLWIFDRTKVKVVEDGVEVEREAGLKLAKFGSKILKQLDALSENPDYEFDTFPMPYDIVINAKGAGDKEVVYTVMPSPKLTPLTAEEVEKLEKQKTPVQIVQAMKDKQMKKDGTFVAGPNDTHEASSGIDYPKDDINPDDIPF